MKQMIFFGLMTLSLSASCGVEPTKLGFSEGGPTAPLGLEARGLVLTHSAPRQILDDARRVAEVAVDGVAFATAASGSRSRVWTGSIRPSGQGYGYSGSPADRLVVELADGTKGELLIEALEGDLSAGGQNFLSGDHVLSLRVRMDSGTDARIASNKRGIAHQGAVQGHVVLEGDPLDVDLAYEAQEYFENDSTGTENSVEAHLTGTMRWPGSDVAVDESRQFRLIAGRGTGSFVATSAIDVSNSVFTTGGDRYAFVAATTKKAFRDGKATEIDTFWGAKGGVTRNGTPFGTHRFVPMAIDGETGGFLKFVLDTPEGRIELESYNAY